MDILDALTTQVLGLLASSCRVDRTPSVRLACELHPTPPMFSGGVRSRLDDVPHVLPALARHAQAGDRHALLLAAVFMREQLRAVACGAARTLPVCDIDDVLSEALTVMFGLLRTAAEPEVLTPRLIAAQIAKRLNACGRDAAVPCDPHAAVFDQGDISSGSAQYVEQLLADARGRNVITVLEHRTLTELYLTTGTMSPAGAAQVLGASTGAVERRAQRAIRKLVQYISVAGPRVIAA